MVAVRMLAVVESRQWRRCIGAIKKGRPFPAAPWFEVLAARAYFLVGRLRRIHPPGSVGRIVAGFAEIVGSLLQMRAQLRGWHRAVLADDQRRYARDMRRRHAGAGGEVIEGVASNHASGADHQIEDPALAGESAHGAGAGHQVRPGVAAGRSEADRRLAKVATGDQIVERLVQIDPPADGRGRRDRQRGWRIRWQMDEVFGLGLRRS